MKTVEIIGCIILLILSIYLFRHFGMWGFTSTTGATLLFFHLMYLTDKEKENKDGK